MNKASKVACSSCSCKYYKVPMYYIGSGYFQSHSCHFRYSYPYLKKKGMVKGTEKNRKIEVDLLRAMRNKNKYNDLDDKIKNLRSELTSLVKERPKMEARSTKLKARKSISSTPNSVTKQAVGKNRARNVSGSGNRDDVNRPQGKQTKTKPDTQIEKDKEFTDWLDTTIDNLNGAVKTNGNKNENIPAAKTVTVEPEVDEEVEIIITDCRTQTDVKIAEELLYESFLVQNYPNYVPGSNGSAENSPEPAMPVNSNKHKLGKPEAEKNAKKAKTSDNKQSSEPKKQDKAVASTFQLSFDSDVEVIDIDDDSNHSSPLNNKDDDDDDKHEVVYIKDDSEPVPEKEETPKEKSGSKKGPWECPICLEQNIGQEVVTTMCGHVFCKKCLEDYYVTHSRTCPTCRCDLLDKPVITLFNF